MNEINENLECLKYVIKHNLSSRGSTVRLARMAKMGYIAMIIVIIFILLFVGE